MEKFLRVLPARPMTKALEREDLKSITQVNSSLRHDDENEYFQTVRVCGTRSNVAERLEKLLDQQEHLGVFLLRSAIRFLEIQVEAVRVLDLRTARDHRLGFDDVPCIPRIVQAIREVYVDLAQLLKQDLVEKNIRDIRLVDGGGGVVAGKELLLTLMKCYPSQARITLYSLLRGWWNLTCAISDTSHSNTSDFDRTVISRDGEYENINDIFHKDYGATQISFVKFLVVDMMGQLP
ncbi:uncharacterized protein FMAN_09327 [Fusarium mangiferae]|uniref:Uncharacterized protein n=1 Tax=Fusarium mangiferae TaxID=192010 RepID=A0A1L7T7A6_FUSMA|nr:uncharacterized protein FMAN_09327 [Fusarium mangiferae]CVK91181.1 uncharacterized protein FMAN_09327 [Fusarium mangiferae]